MKALFSYEKGYRLTLELLTELVMSRLKITRDSGYADRMRDYKVVCNSEVIGVIGNGQTEEFSISEGRNEIYLKIDWCRSNKLRIDIAPNEQLNLQVESNLRGARLLFAIIYILFLPHKYIWLSHENSSKNKA